jgi:lipoprotein signal peptidase
MRLAVLLAVAVPLAAADLVHKASVETHWWAYHERSLAWIALCAVLFVGTLGLVRVPSAAVPPAAGLLAAGVLGNMASAAWNDLRVPNPIVLHGERTVLAFNLADIWALAGILLLVATLSLWLIRNRAMLPSPRETWTFGRWRRGE